MPNEWPNSVPGRRRRPKQPKKSSGGGGSGTTVGMAIVLVVLPALVIAGAFGYVIIARLIG